MPKQQAPKINGSIVNVLVSVSETCNQLSLEGTCDEVILIKLRKIFCKGHVFLEPVRS